MNTVYLLRMTVVDPPTRHADDRVAERPPSDGGQGGSTTVSIQAAPTGADRPPSQYKQRRPGQIDHRLNTSSASPRGSATVNGANR
jgi:hypothetical protein